MSQNFVKLQQLHHFTTIKYGANLAKIERKILERIKKFA